MKKLILLLLILPFFFACTDDTSSSSDPEPAPEPKPIEKVGCSVDDDCDTAAGEICKNGECQVAIIPGCTSNAECDGGVCDTNTHTCVFPGSLGDDCSSGRPCSDGLSCCNGTCVQYTSEREACDALHPCGPGLTCYDGICIKEKLPDDSTCVMDDDCQSGLCKEYKCSSN